VNLGEFDCSTGVVSVLYKDETSDIVVRTSTAKDLLIVDKLMKENSGAIGFLPKTYFEKAVWGGQKNSMVFICEANNDEVGYVYITPAKGYGKYAKIQQIAVRDDARRLQYGTALMDVCRQFCEKFGRIGFTLRCRQDLESNRFWKALGFEKYGVWRKGEYHNTARLVASDDINLYKIELNRKMKTLFND
jgi:GNAT superfamily N-acetyltransferase